jgi:hypothetical protein
VGCCERGDEPSCSVATKLVLFYSSAIQLLYVLIVSRLSELDEDYMNLVHIGTITINYQSFFEVVNWQECF